MKKYYFYFKNTGLFSGITMIGEEEDVIRNCPNDSNLITDVTFSDEELLRKRVDISNGEIVDYEPESVVFVKTYEEEVEEVIQKRLAEYPPIIEFIDAMYHNHKGDSSYLETYYAKCEAVKLKYPKPEEV